MAAFVISPLYDRLATSRAFVASEIAAQDARIEAACLETLKANTFDRSRLTSLAKRTCYQAATATFIREGKIEDWQIAPMLEPPASERLRAFRMARAFGAITRADEAEPFTISDLRRIKTQAAARALAALGEIRWHSASRRVRAVFCFREVVRRSRS